MADSDTRQWLVDFLDKLESRASRYDFATRLLYM